MARPYSIARALRYARPMSTSFFEQLMAEHTEWDEDRRIDAARARADHALAVANEHALDATLAVQRLEQRLAAQAKQLKTLRAVIGVLTTMLKDSGAVDGEMLDIRLEAAIANSEEELERVVTVACQRCGAQVDRRRTVVTGAGTVCDRCHATP